MWKGNDARKCIRNSLRTRVMRAATIALSALILSTACARVAAAAPGDCAAPTAADRLINSTQCLFILKAAVGTETCPTPVCSCDPRITSYNVCYTKLLRSGSRPSSQTMAAPTAAARSRVW